MIRNTVPARTHRGSLANAAFGGEHLQWDWANQPLDNQFALVDADMLRFTDSEAFEYLEMVHGARIDPKAISSIIKKTEGWIAAIQLLGTAMDGRNGDATFEKLGSGKSKILFDQLANATLKSLAAEDLAFLLQVAPLGRFGETSEGWCPHTCHRPPVFRRTG